MEARSAAGVHCALPACLGRPRAGRAGLAARTEVGRLSHHRPQGRLERQAVVARRERLARHLPGHRRGDCGPAGDEPDPRRRGRRAAGGRLGRLLRAAVAESPHRGPPDRLRSPRGRRRRTRAPCPWRSAASALRPSSPQSLAVAAVHRGRRGRQGRACSSGTPASGTSKGSCRSGRARPTSPARRPRGARSDARTTSGQGRSRARDGPSRLTWVRAGDRYPDLPTIPITSSPSTARTEVGVVKWVGTGPDHGGSGRCG